MNQRAAVYLGRTGPWCELTGIGTQAHGAAQLVDTQQVLELVDDLVLGLGVDLGRVGAFEIAHVAGEFGHRPLKAVADAEVGRARPARVLCGSDHAAGAACAKATGHEHRVDRPEQRIRADAFDLLSLHPAPQHTHLIGEAAVCQGFV